jgi:amidase
VPNQPEKVYAHKSSSGLLPSRGHTSPLAPPLPFDRDLTVIGPMARSAADLSLMFDLLADPDETTLGIAYRLALRPSRRDDLAGYRVLVVDTHPLIPSSVSVRNAINGLAAKVSKAGAKVAHHRSGANLFAFTALFYRRELPCGGL